MTEPKPNESTAAHPGWLIALAPIAVMVLIFALSSRSHLPNLDGGHDYQSVAGHFTAYAALGATLTLLFRSFGWSTRKAVLGAVVLATLYGVSDEFHQSFVPNRQVDPIDVFADFVGAVVGSIAMLAMLGRWGPAAIASSDVDPGRPADGSS